ncbi:MAG: phage tail protein [Campylobacteraceae bacterium]
MFWNADVFPNAYTYLDVSGIPTGAIIAFAANTIPSDNRLLPCFGANISRTTYFQLFNVIGVTYGTGDGSSTFALPDLRGYFIRGLDRGRGLDSEPSRLIGSTQVDTMQGHKHTTTTKTWAVNPSEGNGAAQISHGNREIPIGLPVDAGYGVPRISAETRGKNIALDFYIKY